MQQFLVPQFIDVENKILGPITTRQFVIMIGTMGALFIMYKTLDFSAFIVATLITVVIAMAFGFVKVNGLPFHFFVLNIIQTTLRPSLRTWMKDIKENPLDVEKDVEMEDGVPTKLVSAAGKQVSSSRLSELSMIVNTGGYYRGEDY
jgi:hypothetical protein